MGACSRSRELMALSLHSKLWNQLVEPRLRGKRMDQQIAALRLGLEKVLGKVALQLHFGQSLEMSVCGKADIQVADIRNASLWLSFIQHIV